ncbi:lipopolysaccharide transport periplasmic protein LptA [Pseudooceanicola sp. LIPI14-2-Ac024]|uniref:lipopolysaccharide transport periplasmic protein LptA n=1 Tax=Pseudooceanicola sp. LIPI14-2-Ac024 TaxID=3344875 RepID=UPI0035D0B6D9
MIMKTAFSTLVSAFGLALLIALPAPVVAQGPSLAFGSADNSDQPIEIEAENLSVSQNDGTAEFTGEVLIVQGDMRLSAPSVLVQYNADQSGIEWLKAKGGVTMVSAEDAAEAEEATYNIAERTIVMTGDVTIVQGANTLSSETVTIDLDAGTAQMQGRVRTILKTGSE